MQGSQFSGWYKQDTRDQASFAYSKNFEHIVYVGCVHGGNQNFLSKLDEIAKAAPHFLIFAGDLTGTREMEELKKRFYNYVSKPAKEYLKQHPDSSDTDLLSSQIGHSLSIPPLTLEDGYLFLLHYQLELQQIPEDEIVAILEKKTKADIVREIRHICSFDYYGEWAAKLPRATREKILDGLKESAENLQKSVEKIRSMGTKVIMVEGNWDNPDTSGVRFIAGSDIATFFDTKKFFKKYGFRFIDILAVEETRTTLHVFLPFNILLNFDLIPPKSINNVKQCILDAKAKGKQIIMVGHAVPIPEIHNLPFIKLEKRENRDLSTANFSKAIEVFRPNQVIYGHFHDPIKNEKGIKC